MYSPIWNTLCLMRRGAFCWSTLYTQLICWALQSLIRETPARAVDYTQELSRVLRYTLQSNESRFVTPVCR